MPFARLTSLYDSDRGTCLLTVADQTIEDPNRCAARRSIEIIFPTLLTHWPQPIAATVPRQARRRAKTKKCAPPNPISGCPSINATTYRQKIGFGEPNGKPI
jgi:hypothetical protein